MKDVIIPQGRKGIAVAKPSASRDANEIVVTETQDIKRRYSPAKIKEQIGYLEESITKFQNKKAELETLLQELYEQIDKQ